MSTGAAFKRGASCQTYATPECFMAPLRERFGKPVWDLAASPENTKAENFITKEQDSLSISWNLLDGLCFLNPPFDLIEPWAKKCRDERDLGAEILFLVPASIGSEWFNNYVHRQAAVWALRGRIPFDPDHPKWGYPKDCILCHFGPKVMPGFDTWKWRTNEHPTR